MLLPLVAASFVALGTFALSLPMALFRWNVSPDTLEYIGIAYNWVEGQGWSCPVVYSTFLQGAVPPVHGMVMRAPAISFLIAPAIALGASVPQLQILQAAVSSLVAGGSVLVARRSMSLPSAVGFGIALGWSDLWVAWSSQVLSEPIAAGALLLLIAALPRAETSPRAAAGFGALAALAWLSRPNLAIVLAAFVAAIVLREGRSAMRSRPLWSAVLVFAVLYGSIGSAVAMTSGFGAYAHYGLLLQSTGVVEASLFQRSWPGPLAYLAENASRVGEALAASNRGLFEMWFRDPRHYGLGWLALPAWVYGFLRPSRSFRDLVVVISALGFLLFVIVFYGGYDPARLALPAVLCLWLLVFQMLDDLARRLSSLARPTFLRRAVVALPLVLAMLAFVWLFPGRLSSLEMRRDVLKAYEQSGAQRPQGIFSKVPDPVCEALDRDALVAASNPWNVYLWCGNASVWLPPDIGSQRVLARYLDRVRPTYIVSNPGPGRRWPREVDGARRDAVLRASPRLEARGSDGGLVVYRVPSPRPGPARWHAPPPLARMGLD